MGSERGLSHASIWVSVHELERASATPMLDRKYMINLWDVIVDVERDGVS